MAESTNAAPDVRSFTSSGGLCDECAKKLGFEIGAVIKPKKDSANKLSDQHITIKGFLNGTVQLSIGASSTSTNTFSKDLTVAELVDDFVADPAAKTTVVRHAQLQDIT